MTTTSEPRTALVYLEPKERASMDDARAALLDDVTGRLLADIASPQEYEAVADIVRVVDDFIRRYKPPFDDLCSTAHQTWKQATSIRESFFAGPERLKEKARQMIATYKTKQDQVRRDEERRIAEDQRQEEIRRQKADAKAMENAGQIEMAKAIRAQPVSTPSVSLPSIVPDVPGLSFRDEWTWEPVGGDTPQNRAKALSVMVRPEYVMFVRLNDAGLTSFAKRTKGTIRVPGIKFFSRPISVRR